MIYGAWGQRQCLLAFSTGNCVTLCPYYPESWSSCCLPGGCTCHHRASFLCRVYSNHEAWLGMWSILIHLGCMCYALSWIQQALTCFSLLVFCCVLAASTQECNGWNYFGLWQDFGCFSTTGFLLLSFVLTHISTEILTESLSLLSEGLYRLNYQW